MHWIENNFDTESFYQENYDVFKNHCNLLYEMMLRGARLSSRQVAKMDMDSRRLRDLYAKYAHIERKWVYEGDVRKFRIYFIDPEWLKTYYENEQKKETANKELTGNEGNTMLCESLD